MKLNELYNLPLKEALEKMELAEMKVHTDDGGSIKAIELKYTCGNQKQEPEQKPKRASYPYFFCFLEWRKDGDWKWVNLIT